MRSSTLSEWGIPRSREYRVGRVRGSGPNIAERQVALSVWQLQLSTQDFNGATPRHDREMMTQQGEDLCR
jgi:hypothetical protein